MAPTKCFPLMLALLVTLAGADTDEESTFSEVRGTRAIVTYKDVTYTPPMLILGKRNGSIVRCPHATPASCEVYHSGNSTVTATLVHGEFLFAGLESGAMLRCFWQRRHSCSVFNQADSMITGLAVAAGHIHAGLQNGTILRCNMNTPNSCHSFANLGRGVTSLAASKSFIYVGEENGRIERCDISISGSCSLFCAVQGGSNITGLAVVGDTVYGVRFFGYLQNGNGGSDVCESMGIRGDQFGNTAVYDGKLYMVRTDVGQIVVTLPGTDGAIKDFVSHEGVVSISFSYGTYAMQDKYRMESENCLWKGVVRCPPTVFYYEVEHRLTLEVSVKDGRLYDSQNVLVDTRDADEAHGQKAAIFVMGPDGQILLSKVHKTGLLHTSSLLAGNPVSGAGQMVVEQGKIKSITACSVHYRPDQDLNKQVLYSLRAKGYTDSVDSQLCTYSDMLCDVNDVRISTNAY